MRSFTDRRQLIGLFACFALIGITSPLTGASAQDRSPVAILEGLVGAPQDVQLYDGKVYVLHERSSSRGPSVTVYDDSSGAQSSQPLKELLGPDTELYEPYSLAFDSLGNMYVSNASTAENEELGSVVVFPRDFATGNTHPTKVLTGVESRLVRAWGIVLDDQDQLYVASTKEVDDNEVGSVLKYAAGWTEPDTAPIAELTGPATQLMQPTSLHLANKKLLVGNIRWDDSLEETQIPVPNDDTPTGINPILSTSVLSFSTDWTDSHRPEQILQGSKTKLTGASDITVDLAGNLHVANVLLDWDGQDFDFVDTAILTFAAGWNGDVSPISSIQGGNELNAALGLALHPNGNLHVANRSSSGEHSIIVYPGLSTSVPGTANPAPGAANPAPGVANPVPGAADPIPGTEKAVPPGQVRKLKIMSRTKRSVKFKWKKPATAGTFQITDYTTHIERKSLERKKTKAVTQFKNRKKFVWHWGKLKPGKRYVLEVGAESSGDVGDMKQIKFKTRKRS